MATLVRRRRTVEDVKHSPELEKVMAAFQKKYGAKSVVEATEGAIPYRIPLGIFTFDYATLGGIPHNRISMFHGVKHSGKTTGSMRAILGAQQTLPDQRPVFVDVEGTFDKVWAGKIGIDLTKLILVQPDSGEHAVDMTVGLIHTREVSLVVIDSLAALLPIKEQEASAEDALVGLQSRLITRMMRQVSAAQIAERKRDHYVTLLTINQQRSKIGGWSPTGDPISLPGGKALGYFNSLEVKWKNSEKINKDERGDDSLAYNDHSFAIEKNKMNGGIRTGEFRMMRRNDDDLGLTETEIDEGATMLAVAKKEGWYNGGGRAGYDLEFGGYDAVHFDNADEAVRYLYANKEYAWELRCNLIAEHAARMGMPDWYVEYVRGNHDMEAAPQ